MEETNAPAMAGIEQHPDIIALRARYEQAAATPLAQLTDGLVFLTGLYLAISPWVVGFSGLRSMTVNNLITGVALALNHSAQGPVVTSPWFRCVRLRLMVDIAASPDA